MHGIRQDRERGAGRRRVAEKGIAMAGTQTNGTPQTYVGTRTIRPDGVDKVTGRARFGADFNLPGQLIGRVLRSPHPHARIVRIDTSKAEALPGVKAIVTHENCKVVWGAGGISGGQQYNDEVKKITKHRRYAFNNPVRFVGDPVAAVAAVD